MNKFLKEHFQKSSLGNFVTNFKDYIEDNGESIQIQDYEIKYKEELEIYEEPIAFTGVSYQYSQSDKDFSTNSCLKEHENTHSGEQPYQWSQCEGPFSRNCDLIKHQRTHSG
ncbi:unnamed protein product, partial [Meganyctiphanes norvegica]